MTYDNSNSGMLARNERKDKDTHPDFTGTLNVDGVEYWLSAWTKEGKQGSKMEGKRFFSLAVKAKEAAAAPPAPRTAQRPPPPRQSGGYQDPDGDIPFAPMAAGRGFLSL
jgi:hypothetical protein